ncbi:hypothetical protein C5N14_23050 [Micromonospora sp. MW-13]|nr:hypothetical protein C5N14_23050 [Micromonospora sp. MW-13]
MRAPGVVSSRRRTALARALHPLPTVLLRYGPPDPSRQPHRAQRRAPAAGLGDPYTLTTLNSSGNAGQGHRLVVDAVPGRRKTVAQTEPWAAADDMRGGAYGAESFTSSPPVRPPSFAVTNHPVRSWLTVVAGGHRWRRAWPMSYPTQLHRHRKAHLPCNSAHARNPRLPDRSAPTRNSHPPWVPRTCRAGRLSTHEAVGAVAGEATSRRSATRRSDVSRTNVECRGRPPRRGRPAPWHTANQTELTTGFATESKNRHPDYSSRLHDGALARCGYGAWRVSSDAAPAIVNTILLVGAPVALAAPPALPQTVPQPLPELLRPPSLVVAGQRAGNGRCGGLTKVLIYEQL